MRRTSVATLLLLASCSGSKHDLAFGPIDDLMVPEARVEAFRIAMNDGSRGEFLTYPETAGPVVPDPKIADELRTALLDPANFGSLPKGCIPVPGVKVRYSLKGNTADVAFCFECLMLFTYRNGTSVGQEDFDPGKEKFVGIVKRLFPKDPAIQALK